MAAKKFGEFATHNDEYLRAAITQPAVDANIMKSNLIFVGDMFKRQ
jgi:hypothetical protein